MKTLLLSLLFAGVAAAQTPFTIPDLTELTSAPAADDYLLLYDASANAYKKITFASLAQNKQNLAGNLTSISALTDPGADKLAMWDDSAGEWAWMGIGAGLTVLGNTLSTTPGAGGITVPGTTIVGNVVAWDSATGAALQETGIAKTDLARQSTVNVFTGTGRQTARTSATPGFLADMTGGKSVAMVAGTGAGVLTFDEAGAFGISSAPSATVIGGPGSGGTYRLWIDGSNGRVGIGNTSPTTTVDVTGTVNATAFTIGGVPISGTGDVLAAAAFGNDNRILRSDGTGKGAQASAVTLDDSGNIGGVATVTATSVEAGSLLFEGATADAFETAIAVTDPTADRTATLPDRSGTVALQDATSTEALLATLSGGTTQGSVAVRGTSGWLALAPGTAGQVLKSNGAGANLSWQADAGGSSVDIASSRQNVFIWDEFIGVSGSNTFGPLGLLREVTGGTVGSGLPTSSSPVAGVMNLYTGTGTTNKVGVMSNASGFSILFGGGTYKWETRVNIETLPASTTNEYVGRIGFLDAISTQPTDGCYFQYDQASANWFAVCRSNGTETATSTGVAVTANTWIKLRIEVNAAATSVLFYIDGTLVRTETANIPSGANVRSTSIGAGFIKATGSVDNDYFFDYMGLEIGLTSAR